MDSNKRGMNLFGNYNINEPMPNVPGKYSPSSDVLFDGCFAFSAFDSGNELVVAVLEFRPEALESGTNVWFCALY